MKADDSEKEKIMGGKYTKSRTYLIPGLIRFLMVLIIALPLSAITAAPQILNEDVKLTASDGTEDDHFGWAVDLSGPTMISGAYTAGYIISDGFIQQTGTVYLFDQSPEGAWTETSAFAPEWDGVVTYFGEDVSLSGNIAVVGAFGYTDDTTGYADFQSGAAYVLERDE